MKKILFIALTAILFVSCSSGPEGVAKKFTENISKGKIDDAKKYCTSQSGAILDMMKSMNLNKADLHPDYKFTMIKDSIVEDKAWVTYNSANGKEDVMTLVKENGEWKVSLGK